MRGVLRFVFKLHPLTQKVQHIDTRPLINAKQIIKIVIKFQPQNPNCLDGVCHTETTLCFIKNSTKGTISMHMVNRCRSLILISAREAQHLQLPMSAHLSVKVVEPSGFDASVFWGHTYLQDSVCACTGRVIMVFYFFIVFFLFLILTCAAMLFLERRQHFQTSHNCPGFFSRRTVMNSNSKHNWSLHAALGSFCIFSKCARSDLGINLL